MVIEIPTTFFGKPVKGAMKLVMTTPAGKPPKKGTKPPTPSQITNPENYIILEGKTHGSYSYPDLLVPFQRTHFSENWEQAQKSARDENGYMFTIRQFADFLRLLKTGKAYDGKGEKIRDSRLKKLINEITQVKDPWRAEWLDAKFSGTEINYHLINADGSVKEETANLDCLMEDRTPGLSLDSWLQTANDYGLPTNKTRNGKMYYGYPRNGAVARFVAYADWAYLYCIRDASDADPALGVRIVRKKI
jgi:hypothetical protein